MKAAVGYDPSYAFCSYLAIWTARKRHLFTLVPCWDGDAPLWAETQQSLSCNFDSTSWPFKTSIVWKVRSLSGCVCWKCPGKVWSLLPKLKAWAGAEISVNALPESGGGLGRATPSWEQNHCHRSKECPTRWSHGLIWTACGWNWNGAEEGKAPTLVKTGDHTRSL